MPLPRTIEWVGDRNGHLRLLDQTRLPFERVEVELTTVGDAARAILTMQVRGAPLIGAAAAYGVALALHADPSDAGLTGAKEGCDDSECGACMMLVDGQPVNSCSYLALQAEGREITTVEGLAPPGELSDLQRAFPEHGGVQCGFCTPGMLISANVFPLLSLYSVGLKRSGIRSFCCASPGGSKTSRYASATPWPAATMGLVTGLAPGRRELGLGTRDGRVLAGDVAGSDVGEHAPNRVQTGGRL